MYRHSDLRTPRSIRLLQLGDHGPITTTARLDELTLVDVELDKAPLYEALSYVWGVAHGWDEITIDGLPLKVTRSCKTALEHVSRSTQAQYLWVDSICIDQTNVAERSAQVQIMGQIYASAYCVVVWLNMESHNPDALAAFAERVDFIGWKRPVEPKIVTVPKAKNKSISISAFIDRGSGGQIKRNAAIPRHPAQREPVVDVSMPTTRLLTSSWFSRVW
jgi:hypothetical protein